MLEKLMDNYIEKFRKAEDFYKKYNLEERIFDSVYDDIKNFKVNVPIVGIFSSGKTSLINSVIGEKIFKINITPETALPVELTYSDEEFFRLVFKDGKIENFDRDSLKKKEFHIEKHQYITMGLKNDFLNSIKNIKIVDMPGFDSGLDAHTRAIDEYIEKSMAYIIVHDAENGSAKKSVLDFLAELKLFDIPVYSVINKADKKKTEIDDIVKLCKKQMEDAFGIKEIKTAPVSAKKKDIEKFKEYLGEINSDATGIFKNIFDNKAEKLKKRLINYLKIRIKNTDNNLEEIELEEEKLKENLNKFEKKVEEIGRKLDSIYDETVEKINAALESLFINKVNEYAVILSSNGNIENDIKRRIRRICLEKFKTCFEPKMIKYFEHLKDELGSENINIDLQDMLALDDNMIKSGLKSLIIGILTSIGISIGGPLGAIIAVVVTVVVEWLYGGAKKKIREEQIKTKLYEQFPKIISQVIQKLDENKNMVLSKIKNEIKNNFEQEKARIEKAMCDVKKQKAEKIEEQKRIETELKHDLKIIESF